VIKKHDNYLEKHRTTRITIQATLQAVCAANFCSIGRHARKHLLSMMQYGEAILQMPENAQQAPAQ
jgi:hypothetical protein